MTPASMLARKRALFQLAGGAMPDTSEVEVSEVPVALPEEMSQQAEPLPEPSVPVPLGPSGAPDPYGDALARQRSLQLMAGLSRAGGTAIQAISGVAPDQQAASALDQQAKSPVVEYIQRMKLADTERQRSIEEKRASRAAATKALPGAGLSADPDSPESRHAQEVFGLTYPNRYAPEQLARFSVQDFARLKLADKAPQLEAIETTREGQVSTDKRAKESRALQERLAKERKAKEDEDQAVTRETGLRKEFNGLPAVRNYELAAVATDQVKRAAAANTPASDIALVTNYMRALDPSTGVKDQEFNNASSAGGFDDRAKAAYERIVSGKRLTPEMRQDFVASAVGLLESHRQVYELRRKQYEQLAAPGSSGRVALPAGLDLEPSPASPETPPSSPPAKGAPEYPDAPRLKPGQRLVDALKEGETVRVNMGNGAFRVVVKRGDKLREVR